MKPGPQPLTIEEYRRRIDIQKTPEKPKVPTTKPIKRRGGQTVRLKRRRSRLLRTINANPPPPYTEAIKLWDQIDEIDEEMKKLLESRKK